MTAGPRSTARPDSGKRQFFRPTLLAVALVLLIAILGSLTGVWSGVAMAYQRRYLTASDYAFLMGTYVKVSAEGRGAQNAVALAMSRLAEIDSRLGPAGNNSDPARIGAAGGRSVPVTGDMIAVLELADDIVRLSGGAFDPSVGALVTLWGFSEEPAGPPRPPSEPPASADVERTLASTGWHRVAWDGAAGTARVESEGVSLALGGIAKGYALDEAARVLSGAGIARALISGGGDLYLLGQRDDGRPWRIAIRHPREEGYLGVVELPPDSAIATSGDYERYFMSGGERFHHILDPVTGWPARSCTSVTVTGPSAALADALATAVFVLGPEDGLALIDVMPGVEALVVDAAGTLHMTAGMSAVFTPTSEQEASGATGKAVRRGEAPW